MQPTLAPATQSVIAWAIRESGYSLSAIATMLGLPESEIEGWTKGKRPELSKLQAFAKALERPLAAFFLPAPPASSGPAVKFRSAIVAKARPLFPEERLRIREAERIQQIVSWIARDLGVGAPEVPLHTIDDDPDNVARAIRRRLQVSVEAQLSWSSASEALRAWREAVEGLGVIVLMFSMGEEFCRGFSIWDDVAPVIAINTAWLPEARVFTLFHELAHLATRTNSACAQGDAPRSSNAGDRHERWCDRVAAAILLPSDALDDALREIVSTSRSKTTDLAAIGRVAARFRVSRRAAALRLIERDRATWGLFKSIPPQTERVAHGRGPAGRTRAQLRRLRYGQRTMTLFHEALKKDLLGPADVIDYLDVSPDALLSGDSRLAGHEDE
jgi:Zn-dependent peptidase ImmA (M78 family)/transcriptional regulator with XRE-family HTH domain